MWVQFPPLAPENFLLQFILTIMVDWFRKKTWTESDQEDFWIHHKRARPFNKSQYLRIQAIHLAESPDSALRREAVKLLDLLISEFPTNFELACAYWQKARVLQIEGDTELAISNYRAALDHERNFPTALTYAWLDFGWLVVAHDRRDLYPEIYALIVEHRKRATFPDDHFSVHAITAIIAAATDDHETARSNAASALEYAGLTHSGMRYHPSLGLVSRRREPMIEQLRRLAVT
jgi:tetratricopeptide (TPR) repeat protein